ncbi:TlpA family protein disulfide reductase [Paenibacillus lutrae]|uniref:Thioredoxin domain-containing protein n=1 Tax=Paenibacillus lutrae TaxID=2078573 RepID=A0A7X3FF84_9BACL|nr:hypothetical protein [Paenibacillus lutrae]MVO98601.1 hypothetical protein [Paenibacillus lutrae]
MTSTAKPARSSDSGLPLGAAVPALPEHIQAGAGYTYIQPDTIHLLLYTSVHCVHCIDLLPHLNKIAENYPSFSIQLFSTGDEGDHQSMSDYFGWDFPIYSMDQSDMNAYFEVTFLPFMILVDQTGTVAAKGVIYNADDFDQIMKSCRTLYPA